MIVLIAKGTQGRTGQDWGLISSSSKRREPGGGGDLVHLLDGQGAFHALRPEDLRRRPDFFAGVAASFFQ